MVRGRDEGRGSRGRGKVDNIITNNSNGNDLCGSHFVKNASPLTPRNGNSKYLPLPLPSLPPYLFPSFSPSFSLHFPPPALYFLLPSLHLPSAFFYLYLSLSLSLHFLSPFLHLAFIFLHFLHFLYFSSTFITLLYNVVSLPLLSSHLSSTFLYLSSTAYLFFVFFHLLSILSALASYFPSTFTSIFPSLPLSWPRSSPPFPSSLHSTGVVVVFLLSTFLRLLSLSH